jgi:uncharacterized protein YihD (DUF1040 family)
MKEIEQLVQSTWGDENNPLTLESLLNLALAAADIGRTGALGDSTDVALVREALAAAADKANVIASHTLSPVDRRQFQKKASRLAAIAARVAA